MSAEEEELERIRRKKLEELQLLQESREQQLAAAAEAQAEQLEAQRQLIMRQILTPEARERLGNLRVARPAFAGQVEQQLIAMAQSGRLCGKIDDAMLREILARIMPKKKEIRIERR